MSNPTDPETAAIQTTGTAFKPARIGWVDVARGVGMLLVIAGHAIPKPNPPLVALGKWIYSFHIPLFFFISGMLIKETTRSLPWKETLARLLRSLMVPYALFGAIAYFAWLLALRHFGVKAETPVPPLYPLLGLVYGSFNSPLAILDAPIWFFPCLFCTLVLDRALPRQPLAEAAAVVLLFAAGVTFVELCTWRIPWGLDLACLTLPFLYVGRKLRSWLLNRPARVNLICLLLVPVLFLIQSCCAAYNDRVDIARGLIGEPALFLIGGFAGTMGVIFLAPYLFDYGLGSFIGRNTMIIFPMHLFCFSVVAAAILFFPHLKVYVYRGQWETFAVYVLFTCAGLLVIVPVMKALFPWLVPAPRARPAS